MTDAIKVFYVALWRLSHEMPNAIGDYIEEVYADKLDDGAILINGKRRQVTNASSTFLPYPPEAYCTSYQAALDVLGRKVHGLTQHVRDDICRLEPQLKRAHEDASRYAKFVTLIEQELAASEGQ